MTAYRVVVAERKDLLVVTILCEACGSEVSIDSETARLPLRCPSCQREYAPYTMKALTALGDFHRFAAGAEESAKKPIFRFNIKEKEE